MTTIQPPWIILPTFAPIGTEVETINDLVEHTSIEFPVMYLGEKEVHIVATEVVVAGAPGNLWCWIELSPWPTLNSVYWPLPLPATGAYWAAIGGGGGAIAPTAPTVEAATGVTGTVHTIILPWAIHSPWARLVMQTPVSATPLTAFWMCQVVVSAQK